MKTIMINIPDGAYNACLKLKSKEDDGLLAFCLINAVGDGKIVESQTEKTLMFSERVALEHAYYKYMSETAKRTRADFVLADNALQVITYLSKEGYLNDAKIRHDIGDKT